MNTIDFWFEFASTYSYLSAARIRAAAEAAGVTVRWQPFLLGPIFAAQGLSDSPFNLYPLKGRYMWRDMQRLCEGYGLPFQKPSAFPRNGLLAARVACVGRDAPWLPDFALAVYSANFGQDRDIGEGLLLASILDGMGERGQDIVAQAGSAEAKQRLRRQTDRAQQLGIFGAPTFSADEELFWGNDRLEDAIAWAKLGPSPKPGGVRMKAP